ncbi:hypothetical protein WN944_016939 [Citrus x changshan-huyou]|uniref:Uncharacterized protein n=1 Tax=Citrus x changshan-huyou TaxID=2935761 RepID=A0AAP0MCY9_9ROSI
MRYLTGLLCTVHLKFGGGENERESGNNGGRSETREMSFQNEIHACKTVKWRLEVKPVYPGVHTPTLKLANSSFYGKESWLALCRYVHVRGVSHPLETWRALESGPGYLCSNCRSMRGTSSYSGVMRGTSDRAGCLKSWQVIESKVVEEVYKRRKSIVVVLILIGKASDDISDRERSEMFVSVEGDDGGGRRRRWWW